MAIYRLKREHPDAKKVDELFRFLEKNNITLEFNSYGTIITINDKEYELKDNEDGRPLDTIPPSFEYKLTFNKED
jgi:histidinol phosphatase-like PHP family hydrolase